MKSVVLSERLQAVVSMVTQGSRVCDVGCDHGFVSICLIEQKISPYVLAMDVREGPLGAASRHISERGLGTYIETRLSDGLHNYEAGETDSLICAGMGGRLMMRILGEDRRKTDSFKELILQPQSELEQFRAWLWEQGYRITDEKMVEEDGKFYSMMRVTPDKERPCGALYPEELFTGSGLPEHMDTPRAAADAGGVRTAEAIGIDRAGLHKLAYRYGAYLLLRGDDTLRKYLRREERIYGEILERLRTEGLSGSVREERYLEIETLLRDCRTAQGIVECQRLAFHGPAGSVH